ncbi:hypothetical protein GEMRC1_000321 [Eukaryota sp. GEM-RC1]
MNKDHAVEYISSNERIISSKNLYTAKEIAKRIFLKVTPQLEPPVDKQHYIAYCCRVCSLSGILMKGNSIGDEGARALADALKINTTVTSINLSSNSIGDEGARALSDVLNAINKIEI